MYELLIKWGLDNLPKLATSKDSRDTAILVEAIKAKNVLVVERY